MKRQLLIPVLAGFGMAVAVRLIDLTLARLGMHAETTFIDDAIVGLLTAALLFFVQHEHEREVHRQKQCAVVIEQMNHHLRNALQVILYRATLDVNSERELREIKGAVDRIDWALREILPYAGAESPVEESELRKDTFLKN